MNRLAMLACFLLAAGCGQPAAKPAKAPVQPAKAEIGNELHSLPSIRIASEASNVLVSVGTHTLTRARLASDVDIQLAAVRNRLPEEQTDAFRAAAAGRLIEQFVVQSLLMDEAIRREIAVTPEEEQQALDKLSERFKSQGRDLDEALGQSRMVRERLLDELRMGLTIDKLIATILPPVPDPTDQEVAQFTTENSERLQRPERIHARRVLMAVDPGSTEEQRSARRQAIGKLREALVSGASAFDDAARSQSDCPSSARGGDLGWLQRGRMGVEFDRVAFLLPTGSISAVVESPAGFEIIQVEERDEAQQLPRDEVIDLLKRRSRQAELRELVKTMLAQNPATYAPGVSNLVTDTLRAGP